MVRQLNKTLPSGYVARPNVKLGVDVDADVGTLEQSGYGLVGDQGNGGVTTAVWAPPTPTLSVAVDFRQLDVFEVQILREGGLELVAAIELVSPRNKDRPSARRYFVAKCVAYLQQGISVLVVDVVTGRNANLYTALLEQLELPQEDAGEAALYAAACRTVPPDEPGRLETWLAKLTVGESLPALPLWLEADLAVPLELEASYEATLIELRVPV
jgi:hypothetical protein